MGLIPAQVAVGRVSVLGGFPVLGVLTQEVVDGSRWVGVWPPSAGLQQTFHRRLFIGQRRIGQPPVQGGPRTGPCPPGSP